MKIDRRCFLSLVVGGAAGTALTPLPWKLTDDSSIWSQMWPWVPVPPDGEYSYVKTTCSLCPGGCGIAVRKVDERCIKIEGAAAHPVNDGGICILGLSGLQLLYGQRVTAPQKRIGDRGQGRWQTISWQEAIAEVAARLGALRNKGEAHTLACISGTSRGTVGELLSRFLTAYGSPNYLQTGSFAENQSAPLKLMQDSGAMAGFDLEKSNFILSFGAGILDGWGSPVRAFRAHSVWRDSGARFVQVEPRLSNTAAKADKWLAINPGTEGALALGLCHVIVKESLYEQRFVAGFAGGFEEWKSVVMEHYDPDKVAAITGIDKATVISLARAFAGAEKPLALWGAGQGRSVGSITESAAVLALNALVGNINRPGGVWAVPEPDYIDWSPIPIDHAAKAALGKGRLDGAGGGRYPFSGSLVSRLPALIKEGQGYPVQALLVAEANPVYSLPDSQAVAAAFEKIPFVVSFSSYFDETAAHADLILPNHVYLERYEDIPAPAGFQKPLIGLAQPVVAPLFDTRHVGDVVIALAREIGGTVAQAFPWEDYAACLQHTLGDRWETLVAQGYWEDQSFTPPTWNLGFNTSSGKFEFAGNGKNPAADYATLTAAGDEASYPLLLVPYDSIRMTSGYVGDPPFMVKTISETILKGKDLLVEINPETARKAGLSEGKSAQLKTPVGEATVRVHLYEGIMPGVIAMPRGLGHTAYDKFLAGKGINANRLIGPVQDPVTGIDIAWGVRARLA